MTLESHSPRQAFWMTDTGDVAMLDVTTLTLDTEHG
ncbi:protein of unknown function [Cupriavidus taiwanensis]|nr:protein of unknown function [Cupriavidus taiwanensis]